MVFFGLDDEEYDRNYTDKQLMQRLASYVRRNLKQTIFAILFLSISSILNGLIPLLSSRLLIMIDSSFDINLVVLVIFVTMGAISASWILNYIRVKQSAHVVSSLLYDMQSDATNAVLQQDMSFFDKYPTGKLVSRVASDTQNFGEAAEIFIESISGLFVLIAASIPLMILSPELSVYFIMILPFVFLIVLSIRKIARQKSLLGQRSLALVNSFVQDTISGIQITKSFRQEEKIYDKFKKINEQSYKINLQRAMVLNFIFPLLYIVFGISTTLIFYFGSLELSQGSIHPANLYLFLQSLSTIFNPIFAVASFWPQFQSALSAAERIFALIDAPNSVIQKDQIKAPRFKGKIEFKNMGFQYVQDKPVFKDFSLTIQPGESIAIVGHTGAGKSSLAKILSRFYEFQNGDILVDDISIRNYDLKSYRLNLGIIPQVPFLWADSLENNIRYSKPEATTDEVVQALKQAGGAEWIEDLPDGLQTNIRERGSLLSMGQRQLVVFARTLLENPSILILDEATASVDPFTETKIQEALEKTIKGRTSIIIAHRLWTIKHVDRILVFDHGRLIEEGNHESLINKKGFYAELYNTYFRHQSLEFIENPLS